MNYHHQYIGLLLQVIYLIANCFAENLILNVNYKKPIAVTSNAFLSFTLDPATLLHSTDAFTQNIERSTNMARGLMPAYIRLGGSQSNSYIFEREYSHNADVDSNNTFENQWTLIYQWAKNIGFDIIVCIAPRNIYIENTSKIHLKNWTNITELLSFSDLMGYNINWQLGYECQTKCNLSGGDLGQYVANLREMLKTFPRYSNSLITGPDIVGYRTAKEQKYLQDYLTLADTALSAITWHPDFASVSLNNDIISMYYDNMVADKNELYKIISHMTSKKPLWIAESKPEKFKHTYLGALTWTIRLGNAAKLDTQVIMRQPSNFYKATPDYWVSLLHKTLVGRQVLELKLQSNNESSVHLYSQCTKPSALYDKGAITIFGVNLTPKEVTAYLKDLKIKILHKYILSPDFTTGNKMFSEKILLNNKPLDLINDEKLPNLNPEIIIKPDGSELKLSSGDIGFWVIPNAKVEACVYSEEETADNITEKKLHTIQDKNIIQQDNQEERNINNMKNYQHLVQGSGRIKRDIGKNLEIGPRKNNVFKRRPKLDNMKDYISEKNTKRKNDFRRDELSIPFNPRTTDSDENNFYGFFRRKPIKGFPESDIFITMGDSLEQNSKDYDYVEDENNENGSMQNTKHRNEKHIEDDTWIEMENDHIPNEFFENVKFFNTRIKENPKNYDDLLQAEFSPQKYENVRDNDKITAIKVFQEQLPNKKKEKRAVEKSMQQLINYYNSKEQLHDRDTKYEAPGLALRRFSTPLSQFVKSPIYINHQESNIKPEETKLKVESGLKASSFFYQPSQTATVNSNYNNYHTKNIKHEQTNLNKDKILATNISGSTDNIKTETIKFPRGNDVNMEYSSREKQYPIFYNKRVKRSNQAKMQKVLAEEMIKENKENSGNCHCRNIRASHLSKKLCYCRVKRDSQIFSDSSSEIERIKSVVGNAQSKRNVENSTMKEEDEEIMAGEILPSESIESDYEEYEITAGTITTESNTLDYSGLPSSTMQTIDENSTSIIMDNSEINNTWEQYENVDKSNIKKFLINSTFSLNNEEDSNNNNIVNNDITKEIFFRTKLSDVQSENKKTTCDPFQIVSKMSLDNKNNRQELVASTTEYRQETTREKTQDLINKKKKADNSVYSTVTESQKNEERHDNNYKISLSSTNSLETTEIFSEEQATTEAILLKQIADIAIDNSGSNGIESRTKSKDKDIQQNVEDNPNRNIESEMKLKKNIDTKKLKTICQPLRENARYEDRYLNRRAKQINKLKEKLYEKRKRLLQQSCHELTKIADEQKRNLKRRETWEKFYGNDDFRHPIDREEFVGILIDDDVTYKDNNNEIYEIPIEFVSKQYENIPSRLYTLPEVKKQHYPKYSKYYQYPRYLKVIEDDGESTFIPSDRKYNQYYEHLPKIIQDKQEASRFSDRKHDQDCQYSEKIIADESKATSKFSDRRIFAIDPSTYRNGEPILQLYENHSKLPKYYSKIKSENQNSVPRWMLEKISRVLSKSTFSQDQHQIPKLHEYTKKTPIKNDEENANVVYIFDAQRQHNRPNNLARFAQNWLNPSDRWNINQTVNNNTANKLNNIYRNLEVGHDNLDVPITDNKTELKKDVGIGKYIENEQFVNSHDEKKFKAIAESEYRTELLNNKRKNVAGNINNKIVTDTPEINKLNNSNEKIQNDINIKMSSNNKTIKEVEKILDNDFGLSKLEKGNARTRIRRNIEQQKSDEYLQRLLYHLLTKKGTRDGSIYGTYDHLKKSSEEIFCKQPIPLYHLSKNDESLLNTVLFQKLKNYLTCSEKDLEINQQDEKKSKSRKYIVFIPSKEKDSYKMLEVKDYDESLETFEIPYFENQYLSRKLSDSIIRDSDDKSSEELIYENLSDLLNENIENISDKKVYSSENVQDVSVDVKDSGINHELEKEDEQFNSEEIRYLSDQIRSDKYGMFLLFPWKKNRNIRQRREIRNRLNGGINQIDDEMQSNKLNSIENIKSKDIENSLNNNNIDKQEKEKMITKKDIETNYLQTQIDKRTDDNLLEDFIKAQKVIQKLQNYTITDGLENMQNLTESVEPVIENFKEKYNETVLGSDEEKHLKNITSETTSNFFQAAIEHIKKFISFLQIFQIFMSKISHTKSAVCSGFRL
ncbi:uncharacterized protein [Anoplolepis gracilipes]|uniref:uncharacterized protein isoform X2 n=1 Tax=Anoplolepis gracilipes TaxID=354296 RepID=UPI003BA220CC